MMSGQTMQVDALGLIHAVPGKGLTLPNGLHIQYPDLRTVTNEKTGKPELVYTSKGLPVRIYGGKVVENICQAVARQVVAEQMLRVSKRYKVVLTVHDAVAIIAKKEEADEAQAYLEECMSWNPKWAVGLPLACESGVGASYGDC
jgi:DNA polymerase